MPRTLRCCRCGTTENVAIYSLCPACLTLVNAEECAAQGVPAKVEDPEVLARLSRIVARSNSRRAS